MRNHKLAFLISITCTIISVIVFFAVLREASNTDNRGIRTVCSIDIEKSKIIFINNRYFVRFFTNVYISLNDTIDVADIYELQWYAFIQSDVFHDEEDALDELYAMKERIEDTAQPQICYYDDYYDKDVYFDRFGKSDANILALIIAVLAVATFLICIMAACSYYGTDDRH